MQFSKEFHLNIEKIIKYEFGLYQYTDKNAASGMIKVSVAGSKNEKHEQLLLISKKMCKRFKGPHSVLQVFLEKIIDCIGQIHK